MTAQDELMHYGVLGMKWGKRSVGKGVSTAARTNANRVKESSNMKAQKISSLNSKKVAKGAELIKKYGDKYTIIQNKDGTITLKDGNDVWKIT